MVIAMLMLMLPALRRRGGVPYEKDDLTERALNRSSLRESERRNTLREGEWTFSSRRLRASDRSVRGDARYAGDAAGSEAPRRHATCSGSSWCLSAIGIPRH